MFSKENSSRTQRFHSKRSEIAREWDYDQNDLRHEEVAAYSHKKVWWKNTHEKTWKTAINA